MFSGGHYRNCIFEMVNNHLIVAPGIDSEDSDCYSMLMVEILNFVVGIYIFIKYLTSLNYPRRAACLSGVIL